MSSSQIEIPERMLCAGRSADEQFTPEESLYFRYSSRDFPNGHALPTMAIRFPNFSVNRGEYSRPSDVLIPHWITWGIAKFRVMDIPQGVADNLEFRPIHDPVDEKHPDYEKMGFENYAHTEVRAFKNNLYNESLKISDTIRKRFRAKLRDKIRPVIEHQA